MAVASTLVVPCSLDPGGKLAATLPEAVAQLGNAHQSRVFSELVDRVRFEPNVGQANSDVEFIGRTPAGTLLLRPSEAVLIGAAGVSRMHFVGGNPAAVSATGDQLPGRVNYLRGSTQDEWKTDVPTFGRVQFSGVYPGVDVMYHGEQGALEYDLIVAPGADAAQIALSFEGISPVRVESSSGDLLLGEARSQVRHRRPVAYQYDGVLEKLVGAGYVADPYDQTVRILLGEYDPLLPLIIDPLIYSTFLGGGGGDGGLGIAIDGSGHAYVTGQTFSPDYPVAGAAYQSVFGGAGPPAAGSRDAFVTKLAADGSTAIYSTYIGGKGSEHANAIALDGAGNAYITGPTSSPDFPASALPGVIASAEDSVFVTKLNASGSTLVYSALLGGSQNSSGNGIAVDSAGNAYVTGHITGTNFSAISAFQPIYGGSGDGFVAKLNSSGTQLEYASYLGGEFRDAALAIAVDSSGSAYITGETTSPNFPVAAAFQPTHANPFSQDAFVTKVASSGTLAYSTYFGGAGIDVARGVAVDGAGNAYVAGYTQSGNLPVAGTPLKASLTGTNGDGFVAKLNAMGSALVYSTYLGGSDGDLPRAIAVDGAGVAHVAGRTISADFPIVQPVQPTKLFAYDGFVAHLNPTGSALNFSTFIGSSGGTDVVAGIAVDAAGTDFLTGTAEAADFSVTDDPFQSIYGGGGADAFVAKLVPGGATPAGIPPPADFDGDGDTDLSLFRGSAGEWLTRGQPSAFLGLDGDIPVPCEFDGGGDTDRAVFRPSVGG
ncbi:MAG: SBBP repeat-containing protein, partial [Mycobacterium sp.]